MDYRRALGVVLLVSLAGCGALGGSGTATQPPVDAATPTATPAPTPSPTPTATPTPTPLPASFETRTVRAEGLKASFELTGEKGAVRSALTTDITGHEITRGAALQCARASPFVAVSTNQSVADTSVTMTYKESALPANATESELSVFVFNRTVKFYVEMRTTVDAENNTVTATAVAPGQTFARRTENGTERVTPKLDGTRLDNAFVVMHAPTYWEALRTKEVPERCSDGS